MDFINEQKLFTEKQLIRQPWLIGIVLFTCIIILAVFGFGFYEQIIVGVPFGTNPMSNNKIIISFIFALIFSIGLPLLLFTSNLQTIITNRGIYYKYFPFINKFRVISKENIRNYYIRKYKPIGEYLGWGIRYSLKGNGIAFNTMGNIGLQLELINGKKILFGTQKPDKIIEVMNKIMKDK
ncbi:MAG: hypothetical protein N2319_09735 [Candidatus Kapabacteria bacterium]|nr:hypothetical protein [Candidatus Kapabacteria bacterium]